MRRFLACTLTLALAATVAAGEPLVQPGAARLRMLAALQLTAAARGREAANPSKGCDCCEDVAEAKAKAAHDHLPLLVWIGGCDPEARKTLDASGLKAVHCHADEWFGDRTPRLVFPWDERSASSLPRGQITPTTVGDTLRHRGTPATVRPAQQTSYASAVSVICST